MATLCSSSSQITLSALSNMYVITILIRQQHTFQRQFTAHTPTHIHTYILLIIFIVVAKFLCICFCFVQNNTRVHHEYISFVFELGTHLSACCCRYSCWQLEQKVCGDGGGRQHTRVQAIAVCDTFTLSPPAIHPTNVEH